MPRLKVSRPDQSRTEYEFGDHDVTIGREDGNHIVIDDSEVSRNHAVIGFAQGEWWLRDLGSVNGILCRGKRVERLLLEDRSSFEIGGVKFRFTLSSASLGDGATKLAMPASDQDDSKPENRESSSKRGKRGRKGAEQAKQGAARSKERRQDSAVVPAAAATELAPPIKEERAAPPVVEAVSRPPEQEMPRPEGERTPIITPSAFEAEPARACGVTPEPVALAKGARWIRWAAAAILLMVLIFVFKRDGSVPQVSVRDAPMPQVPVRLDETKSLPRSPASAAVSVPAPVASSARPSSPPAPPSSLLPAMITKRQEDVLPPMVSTAVKHLPSGKREPDEKLRGHPATPPLLTLEMVEEVVLFRPDQPGGSGSPVRSPQMDRVLYLRPSASNGAADLVDVWLDQKIVVHGVRVSTEAHLHFSPDGSSWAVHAVEAGGRKVMVLPDRTVGIEGELLSFHGNDNFSVIATVTRSSDEDHLHVNGVRESSYHHITDFQLSQDGRHWAYIAVKRLDSGLTSEPAGERVITDAWQGDIHDHVASLTLSADGMHAAYVAQERSGRQRLLEDKKPLFGAGSEDAAEITGLAFSPDGKRLAWVVISGESKCEFHEKGSSAIPVSLLGASPGIETLLSRHGIASRILYSSDSRHVAFAAGQRESVLLYDRKEVGRFPAIQLDSLLFNPSGDKLACVTLHPTEEIRPGEGGAQTQRHMAILRTQNTECGTASVWVSKRSSGYLVHFGGISKVRFSPDSQGIAGLVSVQSPGSSTPTYQLFINGESVVFGPGSPQAFNWLDDRQLRVVLQLPTGEWSLRKLLWNAK